MPFGFLALLAAFGTLANSLRSDNASVLIRTLLRCSARPNGGGYLSARPLRELRPNGSFAALTSRSAGLPHSSTSLLARARHAVPLRPSSLLTPTTSPLRPHPSLLTPPSSLLPPPSSPLTPHPSPLTPHPSLLTPHSSLLTPHSSLLTPPSSLLTPPSSLLTPHPSLLTPHSGFPYASERQRQNPNSVIPCLTRNLSPPSKASTREFSARAQSHGVSCLCGSRGMTVLRQAQRSPYQGHRGTGSAGPLVSPPGRVGTDDTSVRLGGGGHILRGWAHSSGPLVSPPGRTGYMQ